MGEADSPRRALRIVAVVALHFINVTVMADEIVQQVLHHPRVLLQLPEHVINAQIQRVHHAVFAFIDDEERLAADFEQLRAAVIAAGGMSDQELLVGGQSGGQQLPVARFGGGAQHIGAVQRLGQHLAQAAEMMHVKIFSLQARRDNVVQIGADGDDQLVRFSRRHFEPNADGVSQHVNRIDIAQATVHRPLLEEKRFLRRNGIAAGFTQFRGDAKIPPEGKREAESRDSIPRPAVARPGRENATRKTPSSCPGLCGCPASAAP